MYIRIALQIHFEIAFYSIKSISDCLSNICVYTLDLNDHKKNGSACFRQFATVTLRQIVYG